MSLQYLRSYLMKENKFIKLILPSLNEQLDDDVLMLFRNGVT